MSNIDSNTLKKKATAGMAWNALKTYSAMFIAFVSGVVMARLLTPHEFGCIGMLGIFMTLAATFIDAGFGAAIIQKKNPTQADYSTIFYWNMGMAAIMYLTLYLAAPAIARFYNIPLLCSVLRVQAIVLIVNAFSIVQTNQLRKSLNYKVLCSVIIIASAIALVTSIIMAYNGMGVWSLVAQNLIIAVIPTLVFWIYVKWRPSWIFSWKSFRDLFSFGVYMLMSTFIDTLGTQIQGLLIGKMFNASTLGYYSKAAGTEELASKAISSVVASVAYPLYAAAQDNKMLLANIIRRLMMVISFLTFPLMFILILIAKPLFVLLYSERWLPSVGYFQILCIVGITFCLQSVNTQSIAAIGKSKEMFLWTLVKRGLGLTVVIGGLFYAGMKGLLIGIVIYNFFNYFVNIGLVSKFIGYKWFNQLKDLTPVTIMSLLALALSYISTSFMHLGMYAEGAVRLLVYVLIYFGWSFIFKPEAYRYTLANIPAKFRIWEKFYSHRNVENNDNPEKN